MIRAAARYGRFFSTVAAAFPLVAGMLLPPEPASAEITWEVTIQGDYTDEGRAVLEAAPDGGYIVAGHTTSWGPGAPDQTNPFLLKLDVYGSVVWKHVYTDGITWDTAQDLRNPGYVLCGQRLVGGFDDGLLIKTDAEGNQVWSRQYGGPWFDTTLAVTPARAGGYIVAGASSSVAYQPSDAWLLRVDANGDTLWTRRYGGPAPETARSVSELPDGSIVLCVASTGILLIKTDSSGNVLWERLYEDPHWLWPRTLITTSDKGFAVIGTAVDYAGHSDILLVKLDSQGLIEWTRQYDLEFLTDVGESFRQTEDGGFIICGYTNSIGAGQWDLLLVRTDEQGKIKWVRTHAAGHGRYTDGGYAVQMAADGGFVATGITSSIGPGIGIYVVKTDRDGAISPPLTADVRRLTSPREAPVMAIRPNPFVGSASLPGREDDRFVLYDLAGRVAGEFPGSRIGSGLPAGIYFVRDGERTVRVVKLE